MRKIKALQFLVYITFGLFILQPIIQYAYNRSNGYYIHRTGKHYGEVLPVVLNGNFIEHQADGRLQVNPDYTLQNIKVKASVLLNKQVHSPLWLLALNFVVAVTLIVTLWFIALTINKIILKIAEGTMFDEVCINLIRKTASLLLMYALADYAYQQITYFKTSLLVHGSLTVMNTSVFSFPVLICGILVFIIAEAFKQGNRLKEEQELTI